MKILRVILFALYFGAVLFELAVLNAPRELVCVTSGDGVMLCRSFISTAHAYVVPGVIEHAVPAPAPQLQGDSHVYQ